MLLFKRILCGMCLILIAVCGGMVFGCNHSSDFSQPNMSWKHSVYSMNVGQRQALDTLLIADIDLSDVVIYTYDAMVVDVIDNCLVGVSEGDTIVEAMYEDVAVSMVVYVASSTVYATQIVAKDNIHMNVGDSIGLKELYSVLPSNIDVVEDVFLSSNLQRYNNEIIATGAGSGYVTIEVANSKTTRLVKTINVHVQKNTISINAEILNTDLSSVEYIYKNHEYSIVLSDFAYYDNSNIMVSDNIVIQSIYNMGEDKIIVALLDEEGDYVIQYEDDCYIGVCELTNNYIHRDTDKYSVEIVGINGEVCMEDGVYTFYIPEEGTISPYARSARINVLYDGVNTDYTNVSISNNNGFVLNDNIITVAGCGSAILNIDIAGFEYAIDICSKYSYIQDFNIVCPTVHNMADGDVISVNITKDQPYNIYPADPRIIVDQDGVRVDGYNLIIEDFATKVISGMVVVGDIVKEFEISIFHYIIDEVEVWLNMANVGSDIVVDYIDWYVLNIVFKYNGEIVEIDDSVKLTAVIIDDNNETSMSITNIIRAYVSTNKEIRILDENGQLLYKINITLKNV